MALPGLRCSELKMYSQENSKARGQKQCCLNIVVFKKYCSLNDCINIETVLCDVAVTLIRYDLTTHSECNRVKSYVTTGSFLYWKSGQQTCSVSYCVKYILQGPVVQSITKILVKD